MNTVFTILSVAGYERKMLMRTIRFRILGGIGVLIPLVLGIGLAIAESRGVEFESVSGIGAYMPFFCLQSASDRGHRVYRGRFPGRG